MKIPIFEAQTEWIEPEEYPDLRSYDEIAIDLERSEERRVGKEWRYRWSTYHEKKKKKIREEGERAVYEIRSRTDTYDSS